MLRNRLFETKRTAFPEGADVEHDGQRECNDRDALIVVNVALLPQSYRPLCGITYNHNVKIHVAFPFFSLFSSYSFFVFSNKYLCLGRPLRICRVRSFACFFFSTRIAKYGQLREILSVKSHPQSWKNTLRRSLMSRERAHVNRTTHRVVVSIRLEQRMRCVFIVVRIYVYKCTV